MGWDPKSGRLREINDEVLAAHPEANLWQQFSEGETVLIKREADIARPFRAKFRIVQISEDRIVLVAVGAPQQAMHQAENEKAPELAKTAT